MQCNEDHDFTLPRAVEEILFNIIAFKPPKNHFISFTTTTTIYQNLYTELTQKSNRNLMPNSHRRQSEAGSRRSTPPEKNPPHFFKIIHSSTVEKHKLKVPPKFVRKHGENLSNTIFLKVPNGEAEWRVESKKNENGEVWLDRGWQDFADFHSIQFGHFLVFKLEGNSLFTVLIFDKTASEIEYPFKNPIIDDDDDDEEEELKVPKMEENEDDDNDDDVSIEILDDFPSSQTRNEKRVKTKNDDKFQHLHSQSYSIADRVKLKSTDFISSRKVIRGGMFATQSPKQPKIEAAETEKLRALALERAKAFKSKHPFFMVIMQPSYVSSVFSLNVPLTFAKKYFPEGHSNVLLRVSDDERTWVAKYSCGFCRSRMYGVEWKTFVRDNRLKVGDVCVFELTEEVENSLKVVIFRAN